MQLHSKGFGSTEELMNAIGATPNPHAKFEGYTHYAHHPDASQTKYEFIPWPQIFNFGRKFDIRAKTSIMDSGFGEFNPLIPIGAFFALMDAKKRQFESRGISLRLERGNCAYPCGDMLAGITPITPHGRFYLSTSHYPVNGEVFHSGVISTVHGDVTIKVHKPSDHQLTDTIETFAEELIGLEKRTLLSTLEIRRANEVISRNSGIFSDWRREENAMRLKEAASERLGEGEAALQVMRAEIDELLRQNIQGRYFVVRTVHGNIAIELLDGNTSVQASSPHGRVQVEGKPQGDNLERLIVAESLHGNVSVSYPSR